MKTTTQRIEIPGRPPGPINVQATMTAVLEQHRLTLGPTKVLRAILGRLRAGLNEVPGGHELAGRTNLNAATCTHAMQHLVAIGVLAVTETRPPPRVASAGMVTGSVASVR